MEKYAPDTLYKGMTRPALKAGMPYLYATACLPVYVIMIALTESLTVMIALPFIMVGIGTEITRRDVHLVDIYWAKLNQAKMHNFVIGYWKARTYRPD